MNFILTMTYSKCKTIMLFLFLFGLNFILGIVFDNYYLLIGVMIIEFILVIIILEYNSSIIYEKPEIITLELTEIDKEEYTHCIICIDDNINDLVKTECNHIYHKKCINKWIKENNTCPICRVNLR